LLLSWVDELLVFHTSNKVPLGNQQSISINMSQNSNPWLTVFIALLLLSTTIAWLMPPTRTTATHTCCILSHTPGVFFGPEEDFECPDEEECEIDWDRMPGFDDEKEHNTQTEPSVQESSEFTNPTLEYTSIGDEDPADDDLQPKSYEHQVQNSLEKSRTFYEMSWQVDECNVEPDSCSNFCPDCAGSGRQFCKFCRGTRTIAFAKEFRTCLVCHTDGKVECYSCRGTGSVAPWAMTYDKQST
jgi:hypothetical protein